MKKLYLFIPFLLFVGCYSAKKAQKQILKAQIHHPEIVAEACAAFYPTKDSIIEKLTTIPGTPIIETKFLEVDCDSVLSNNATLNTPNKVKVPCNSTHTTDTIYKEKISYQKSTAELKIIEDLKLKNNTLQVEKKQLEQKVKDANAEKNKWRRWFFIACSIIGIGAILKLKGVF